MRLTRALARRSNIVRYRQEVLNRIEAGTYRMALRATNQQILESIEDIEMQIRHPKCEPDVKEWKRADLRALRRVLRERENK